MQTTKRKLLVFFTLLTVILLVLTVFACNPFREEEDEPENAADARSMLITNGTFYDATTATRGGYIKETVTGWYVNNGSRRTSDSGVTYGVIDLAKEDEYNRNKDKFGTSAFPAPERVVDPKTPEEEDEDTGDMVLQDTNALVLASLQFQGSIYYKNASSFTLQAGKYYLLTYSVKTNIDTVSSDIDAADKDKKGAWVIVDGGVRYTDSCINTNGVWQQRSLLIEANKFSSKTIDIYLWLGYGPEKVNNEVQPYSTRGSVFFDNLICTEVTEHKDARYDNGLVQSLDTSTEDKAIAAHANFESFKVAATGNGEGTIGYESMYYLSDLNLSQSTELVHTGSVAQNYFNGFREGTYSSVNVKNYSLVKGKSDLASSDMPSVTNAYSGIVDFSKLYNDLGAPPLTDAEIADLKDNYSKILSTSYTFKGPTYTEWYNSVLRGTSRGDITNSLEETKALMIYNNDLTGVGYTNSSNLVIEKNKYYKIDVWAYVWLPMTTSGENAGLTPDFPMTNAPKEPTTNNNVAKYLRSLSKNAAASALAGFFADLTAEEIADADVSNKPAGDEGALNDYYTQLLASDPNLVEGFLNAISDSSMFPNLSSTEKTNIFKIFVEQYVAENIDSLINNNELNGAALLGANRELVEYLALAKRAEFLGGTEWESAEKFNAEYDKWEQEYAEYMAKYYQWTAERNNVPYATVKLTGAGDDITLTTQKESLKGDWEKLTFYVQGNQLSNRNLKLEFWFGEGSATDYANLMFGGVFFDNISILEIDEEIANKPVSEGGYEGLWNILSPITDETDLEFGGLIEGMADNNIDAYWKMETQSGTSPSDADKIFVDTRPEEKIGAITISAKKDSDNNIIEPENTVNLLELIMANTVPTASALSSLEKLEILPNSAYRLSLRVMTKGLKTGQSAKIELLGADYTVDLADAAAVSSESSFRTEDDEWKEIAFYILGDTFEKNWVSLKITLGEGGRFTNNAYVQGEVHIAVINCVKIKYSEFSASTKSGDITKSYTFSNSKTPTKSVTNGNFSYIDLSKTDIKEFDSEGKLKVGNEPSEKGVGSTQSWTLGTAKTNTFDTWVTGTSGTNKGSEFKSKQIGETTEWHLSWQKVYGIDRSGNDIEPTHYEIYAKYRETDGTDKNKDVEKLWKTIAIGDFSDDNPNAMNYYDGDFYNVRVDMADVIGTSFRIRAVRVHDISEQGDGVGSYSPYIFIDGNTNGKKFFEIYPEASGKMEIRAGTVSNEGLFGAGVDAGIMSYKSPYKTAMMISSNYDTAISMKSNSSDTLSGGSYYMASVWVKTEPGTKASITLANISSALNAELEAGARNIGFFNVDTNGEWVQYRFYVRVGSTSGSLTFELSLGNPYATKYTRSSELVTTSSVAVYDNTELSKGTVYFDGVHYSSVTEKQYNDAVAAGEFHDEAKTERERHRFEGLFAGSNEYVLCILRSDIDSFDSFTENTETEGNNGYNLGNTPKSYSWSKEPEVSGTTEDDRLYGVYNYDKDLDKLKYLMYTENKDNESANYGKLENQFADFLPDDFSEDNSNAWLANFIKMDGNNSLVMSNKTAYAQYYTYTEYPSIASESYYKLSFNAKALVAVKNGDTFTTEGANAEFRYSENGDVTKYQSLLLNSYEVQTYTMYLYNESTSSKSPKWSFHLGGATDTADTTGTKQLLYGMLVIDQIELVKIDEEEYNAFFTDYDKLSDEAKLKESSRAYQYKKDEEEDTETPGTTEPEPKNKWWENSTIWLMISSIIIGAIIIVVVIVVFVKRVRKRHPKEVKGENIVQTVKEIQTITPNTEKEEFLESDEYSDIVEQPKYQQRVVNKKKKKK